MPSISSFLILKQNFQSVKKALLYSTLISNCVFFCFHLYNMETVSIQVINGHANNNLLQNGHLNVHLNGEDRLNSINGDSDSSSDKMSSSEGSLKAKAPIDEIVQIAANSKRNTDAHVHRRVVVAQKSLCYAENGSVSSSSKKLERSRSVNVPDESAPASPLDSIKQRFSSRFSNKRSSLNHKPPGSNASTDYKATNQHHSEYIFNRILI